MIGVKLITVGTLKEEYWRSASAEYQKRLSALCRFEEVQLKEEKLSDRPSEAEIRTALDKEAEKILAQIPPKAYAVAMCVEGKQLSSEELAAKIEEVSQTHGEICLIIGSSYGLSERVKAACRMRLSVSKLTFPHQLMRVLLLEAVYRGFQINKGTQYHK